MQVRYLKSFTGHVEGHVIDTDIQTANYLIVKGVAEKYSPVAAPEVDAPVVYAPVVDAPVVDAPEEVAPVIDASEEVVSEEVTPEILVETSELFSAEYLKAVETLKASVVADLPYPKMGILVRTLGIATDGATKPALIKGLNDFKSKL